MYVAVSTVFNFTVDPEIIYNTCFNLPWHTIPGIFLP